MSLSDALYEELLAAHRDLDAERSAALNRALVLLLADALDDEDRFRHALHRARDVVVRSGQQIEAADTE